MKEGRKTLAEIAMDEQATISDRCDAIRRLENQEVLETLARSESDADVIVQAVWRLTKRSVLKDILEHSDLPAARVAAFNRLRKLSWLFRLLHPGGPMW